MTRSYEPNCTSAYSDDLRWRMAWQREALGFTCNQIATNLGVDKSMAHRTVQLFLNTSSVCKRPYPNEKALILGNEHNLLSSSYSGLSWTILPCIWMKFKDS